MILMPLTKGHVALLDDQDADLAQHRYHATENGFRKVYAQRSVSRAEGGGKRYLHREVAERALGPVPKGFVVDHINHDTLDTQRANLRIVPHRVNIWNQDGAGRDSKSGLRGVRQHRGRWQAYICVGKSMRVLGTFDTSDDAVAARRDAERERELSLAV